MRTIKRTKMTDQQIYMSAIARAVGWAEASEDDIRGIREKLFQLQHSTCTSPAVLKLAKALSKASFQAEVAMGKVEGLAEDIDERIDTDNQNALDQLHDDVKMAKKRKFLEMQKRRTR